jgi:hypothetical protein
MLYLSIISYVFSSTKLEKRQNRFCLESRGCGAEGRDGPNNVCTYE